MIMSFQYFMDHEASLGSLRRNFFGIRRTRSAKLYSDTFILVRLLDVSNRGG